MKLAATLAAVVLAAAASTADAQLSYTEFLQQQSLGLTNSNSSNFAPLILGGTIVPVGSNTYTSG
ncbi:Serine protease trypsin-like protein, partial [Globisporangium polare]